MLSLVFRPEKAPVVRHERLYRAYLNGRALDFFVRARNAALADAKLGFCLRRELKGKTHDFDLGEWRRKEGHDGQGGADLQDPAPGP